MTRVFADMTERHGFSIGMERLGEEFFLTLKAMGTLRHEDYEVITPVLESALAGVQHPRIRAFVDCTELEGWELRAAWDDFRLGMRLRGDLTRIALVGRPGWHELAARVSSWFLTGEIQYFEDAAEARNWLLEETGTPRHADAGQRQ